MKSERNQGKISTYTGWTRAAGRILLTAVGFAVISQLIVLLLPLGVIAQEGPTALRCGWYPWDPYQYLVVKQDAKRLTGLDVKLVRAVFAQMGYVVHYDEVSWRQHQLDVKNGARDIAAGAFKNPERADYAYFSAPYRKEADVLYVRKGEALRYGFKNIDELFTRFREQDFRLGVINGFYYGPDVMRFINDPANASRIVGVPDDVANFENLLHHKIDGFIVDRLVGSTLAWRHDWQLTVEEVSPPVFSENIHVMFSKKTTTPELVEAFNRSLNQLKRNGQYGLIIREYLFPALLGATVGQRWFFTIDILGTIAFAISGILLARQGGYSLFGAFVLASLPAVGGGIIRDVIRADANNPFLKGTFYAEVALIWGLTLSLFLTWYANLLDYKPAEISLAVIATLMGVLLTRMTVFHFKVKSPMY